MSDIQELMARDPLELTKDDVTEIVKQLRTMRAGFDKGNLKSGSAKPKTEKQKEIAKIAEKLQVNLGDL